MSETEASAEPVVEPTEVPTQRLAFDKNDNDIPLFLRKASFKQDEPEKDKEDLEPEAKEAISTDIPADIPAENETENVEMENLGLGVPAANPAINGEAKENLSEMSVEQLKAQQAEINRRINEKQAAEKEAVIRQIQQVVSDYDIPVDELVEALGGMKLKRKGQKAKAKYKDPASGTTWSGRGKEPSWIKGVTDRTPFEI